MSGYLKAGDYSLAFLGLNKYSITYKEVYHGIRQRSFFYIS
jgi:hypothetical protein